MQVLDVGCGTGFPLMELAQRLGSSSFVVGVDPWSTALRRAAQKQRTYRVSNAAAVAGDGAHLPLASASVDLVVSNLGINNLADPEAVMAECARVAKSGAVLGLTTNLRGHWETFYQAFERTLRDLGRESLLAPLRTHVDRRVTIESTRALLERHRFVVKRVVEDGFKTRFLDGSAFLRHSFVRLGFMDGWKQVVPTAEAGAVFARLEANLNEMAEREGALELTVPMAYLEGERI
jgi:SAM-dependent methyltransferase